MLSTNKEVTQADQNESGALSDKPSAGERFEVGRFYSIILQRPKHSLTYESTDGSLVVKFEEYAKTVTVAGNLHFQYFDLKAREFKMLWIWDHEIRSSKQLDGGHISLFRDQQRQSILNNAYWLCNRIDNFFGGV